MSWAVQLRSGYWIVVLAEREVSAPYYRTRRGPFKGLCDAEEFCRKRNANRLDAIVKNE